MTTIYHARLQTPFGRLHLFGSARGLLRVALPNEPRHAAEASIERALGRVDWREEAAAHAVALAQLAGYFAGERKPFDVPLDVRGTPFQRLVWEAVAAVPYGQTRTYSEIARAVGRPAAFRAVGAANGANPVPPIVPCHRIVGADGDLTGYGGGLAMKQRLLELERGDREG
jgi:methylated-DNA-[protein]-cysteine S-methyltransferase